MPLTITISDIYGTDEPEIPDGWEVADLILCKRNGTRTVLCTDLTHWAERTMCPGVVLLELRRKPALVRYYIDVPEGQEPVCFAKGEIRPPQPGENYLLECGMRTAHYAFTTDRQILTPVEAKRVEK
jgi:hypothetical protein